MTEVQIFWFTFGFSILGLIIGWFMHIIWLAHKVIWLAYKEELYNDERVQ